MCYDQYKQWSEIPKAWKDKKQDKMNQQKKGFQPTPFWNMEKNLQRTNLCTKNQNTQGGG